MDGMQSSLPIDATSRGARRLFKARHAETFAQVCASFRRKDVASAAQTLASPARRQWPKAIGVLDTVLDPLGVRVARNGLLVWRVIAAQAESPLRSTSEHELTPDQSQPGASLFYLSTAPRPHVLIRGLWSLVATDHALARFYQRNPGGDLDEALHECHARILAAPERNATEFVTTGDIMVEAGAGYFWCSVTVPTSQATANRVMLWRARSWLHADQISRPEVDASRRLMTAQPGDVALAARVLNPLTLRRK